MLLHSAPITASEYSSRLAPSRAHWKDASEWWVTELLQSSKGHSWHTTKVVQRISHHDCHLINEQELWFQENSQVLIRTVWVSTTLSRIKVDKFLDLETPCINGHSTLKGFSWSVLFLIQELLLPGIAKGHYPIPVLSESVYCISTNKSEDFTWKTVRQKCLVN